jgi:class 3 adenylate cyclase
MSALTELRSEVASIFASTWNTRAGQVVPESENVQLRNDAVTLDGTVLYADLVESTSLVSGYKAHFAAEVYKAYLVAAARVIRGEGGKITAFDGDRIMAVFIGDTKNSSAARAALKLNWAVKNIVNPGIKKQYPNTSYEVAQAVGIDTSELFIAKTGIRGSNDLVWVGRAANYAAKLCAIRGGANATYITSEVFGKLSDDLKYGGSPRQLMWEKASWAETGQTVYRSSYWWAIT